MTNFREIECLPGGRNYARVVVHNHHVEIRECLRLQRRDASVEMRASVVVDDDNRDGCGHGLPVAGPGRAGSLSR